MDMNEHTHQGIEKTKRYGWVTVDAPGELRMIHKKDLFVHPAYQREMNALKVKEITSEWSWIGLGALIVAERDGKLWVVDGQHRCLAALRRSDITQLPCVVFKTKGVIEEARGFLLANANRKPITALGKHKALVASEDSIATTVNEMLVSNGLTLSPNGKTAGQIRCIGWLNKKVAIDCDATDRVLALGVELSTKENIAVPEMLLSGLWVLHLKCGDGLDDKRLVSIIRAKGAQELLESARKAAAYYGYGKEEVWAEGMLNLINKGLQKKFSLSILNKQAKNK